MGNWKSMVEMEECLTLQELNILVEGARKREERHNKFMAAIQGIDLDDEPENDGLPTFDDIKRKAEAIRRGLSEKEVEKDQERQEFAALGIDFA